MDITNEKTRHLIIQSLIDAWGYPKSDIDQKKIGYSIGFIDILQNKILYENVLVLSNTEKQIILNCIDGAVHYVDIDIPSLYDISEDELIKFKEQLEKEWDMKSTYGQSGGGIL